MVVGVVVGAVVVVRLGIVVVRRVVVVVRLVVVVVALRRSVVVDRCSRVPGGSSSMIGDGVGGLSPSARNVSRPTVAATVTAPRVMTADGRMETQRSWRTHARAEMRA